MILEQVIYYPSYFFLILGLLLLAAELIGAGGYSLWSGVAAIIVSIVAYFFDLTWSLLWLLFSVITFIVAFSWWRWSRMRRKLFEPQYMMNERNKQLIGTRSVVTEAINNGTGRVQIADGSWLAKCDQTLAKGTQVKIVNVDGITLIVEPLDK